MIDTIIDSQNVKIPGHMDLIPGHLDKWSNSLDGWQVCNTSSVAGGGGGEPLGARAPLC